MHSRTFQSFQSGAFSQLFFNSTKSTSARYIENRDFEVTALLAANKDQILAADPLDECIPLTNHIFSRTPRCRARRAADDPHCFIFRILEAVRIIDPARGALPSKGPEQRSSGQLPALLHPSRFRTQAPSIASAKGDEVLPQHSIQRCTRLEQPLHRLQQFQEVVRPPTHNKFLIRRLNMEG